MFIAILLASLIFRLMYIYIYILIEYFVNPQPGDIRIEYTDDINSVLLQINVSKKRKQMIL